MHIPDGAQAKEPGRGKIVPGEDKAFEWLWIDGELDPYIAKFDRIILAVDNDKPGRIMRDELAVRLDRTRCYSVAYPEGCKGAGDVIAKHGPEALAQVLRKPEPIVPDRLQPVLDIAPSSWLGVSTGWRDVDEYLKVGYPELMVVLGTPNSGKSQWVTALVANLARIHGYGCSILQLEDAIERLQSDLRAYHAAWRGQTQGVPVPDNAEAWINGHFYSIPARESADAQDLEFTVERMQEASQRHGHRVFVIDPWNELEHFPERGETETMYTAKSIRRLKMEARRLQLLLIIVVHPTKSAALIESIEMMTLYDAAGSSAWNDKADHGIILRRPNSSSSLLHVKVAKVRDQRRGGRPGLFTMKYNPRNVSYLFVQRGIDEGSDAS